MAMTSPSPAFRRTTRRTRARLAIVFGGVALAASLTGCKIPSGDYMGATNCQIWWLEPSIDASLLLPVHVCNGVLMDRF